MIKPQHLIKLMNVKIVEKFGVNGHKTAKDILTKPIAGDEKTVTTVSNEEIEQEDQRSHKKTKQQWTVRIIIFAIIAAIIISLIWYYSRPTKVTLIQPKQAVITETIASSGRVGGTTETNVGSQSQGVVRELNVKEGDTLMLGQEIATIKNDVAEAQITQAKAAVETARSQLVLASRGALNSDIDSVMEQVRQANAQVQQQRSAVTQAQKSVLQANAVLAQFVSERELASKELARSKSLVDAGVISRSEYDAAVNTSLVASKRVDAQKRAIEVSQAGVSSAQASLRSAQANVSVQQARLRTIQLGARPEDIKVARQRVTEADKALQVAKQQAGNAVVTAPFAGTVTKINTEIGQTVGSLGILTLVSIEPEIRLDVDEGNLSEIKIGQEAIISSGAFSDNGFNGKVSELGAAVDQARGTILIKIVPVNPPDWLRPGQTVNVNIITAKNVTRLLVPQTSLIRSGDVTFVFVIENGKAAQKIVVTRPLTNEGVPVISGLEIGDLIISDTANITVGKSVQAK